MKIYVAGTFMDQHVLRAEAEKLWAYGHEITGTWLQEVARPTTMDQSTFWRKLAIKDMVEVGKADLIILDNRQSSGGKNCEWGMGCRDFQAKLLWLVGEPTNVFHELADRKFSSWDELIASLGQGTEITKHAG